MSSELVTKTCDTCGKALPLEGFRPHRRYKDGVANTCNACHAAQERRRRGGTRRLMIDLPDDLRAAVSDILDRTGKTPAAYLEELIRGSLKKTRG